MVRLSPQQRANLTLGLAPVRNHYEEQADWDRDQLAELDITGGFDPSDVCGECWTARSKSGACAC